MTITVDIIRFSSSPLSSKSEKRDKSSTDEGTMLSASTIILEYVCPAAGMICGNIMFFAPFFDVRKASLSGSLGELNPTPWYVMCIVLYACITQQETP